MSQARRMPHDRCWKMLKDADCVFSWSVANLRRDEISCKCFLYVSHCELMIFHHTKVVALMSMLKLLEFVSTLHRTNTFFPWISRVNSCCDWPGKISFQVLTLMWMRTIMNYQYRYGVVLEGRSRWERVMLPLFFWMTQMTHIDTHIWMLQLLGSVRSKSSRSEFFASAKSRRGLCEYDGTT